MCYGAQLQEVQEALIKKDASWSKRMQTLSSSYQEQLKEVSLYSRLQKVRYLQNVLLFEYVLLIIDWSLKSPKFDNA